MYISNLEKKKAQAAATEKEVEKKKITDSLQETRNKVSKLKKMSKQLVAEADLLAADAEKKHKMDLLVKFNALRAKSVSKRKAAESEEKNIEQLQNRLKNYWILRDNLHYGYCLQVNF